MIAQGTPASAQHRSASEVILDPCVVPRTDTEALCGTLTVPENRETARGRSIDLAIVVLPATGDAVEPDPVFALHGGPGAAARFLIPLFASHPLRDERDFVFVDQRGTGESNGLHCEPTDLDELLDVILLFAIPARDCLPEGTEPALYSTSVAMDDLEAVRVALGYDRINLWGGSYGSRAALDYMRRHPGSVRTALLDGAAPTSMYIPLYFPPGAESALTSVFQDCARDPRCDAAFPDLRRTLARVLGRVEESHKTVMVIDPMGGTEVPIDLGRQHVASSILFALYDARTAAQLPRWIHQADQGDLTPLAQFAAGFARGLAPQFAFGMMLAVSCAEDAARFDAVDAERVAEDTFLGPWLGIAFLDACALWPSSRVDPAYWTFTRSDAPTLVFSGEGDPVTPPRWAERVVEHLSNGRHAVFKDGGHGATGSTCGSRLFDEFVRAGSEGDLDLTCPARTERPAWGGLSGGP